MLNCRWHKYSHKFTNQFCMLDFGQMFSGKSLNAMGQVALYAYTEVEADKAGKYLLKVQGDDNIVVWINGARVIRITDKGPPIRTAREVAISLVEGRNRILFRLNQKKGQWLAGIRIRAAGDKVTDARGISFDEQSVDFYR